MADFHGLGPGYLELWGTQRQVKEKPEDPEGALPVFTLAELQRRHIARILEKVEGKKYGKGGAAELLGLKSFTFQSRMKRLGIQRKVTVLLDRER